MAKPTEHQRPPTTDAVDSRLALVLEQVVRRRSNGEALPDDAVIRDHPELMPELGERLRVLKGLDDAERRALKSQVDRTQEALALDLPQDTLPGYELLELVARGGQGTVYRALQRGTNRVVAVKLMHRGAFHGSDGQARFEREVRLLAQLKHPNIVTIHDSGVIAGYHYFVMDYIDGRELDEYAACHALTPDAAIGLFSKICDAVHAGHVKGVIHRDLKPSNIRVDARAEPYILDFGLAKLVLEDSSGEPSHQAMTTTGQFVGSLPWASPEQIRGSRQAIDLRVDVYALGAVLFQMLTGRPPFKMDNGPHDTMQAILERDPPLPSSFCGAIDGDLGIIVCKCLAKDPAHRYQSVSALEDDLQRYVSGQPIQARPPSTAYQIKKLVQRHKLPAVLTALFVVSLVLFSVWMTAMYGRARRAEREATARRAEAQRQADTAHAVNSFLTERILANANPSIARGHDMAVSEALAQAARTIHTSLTDQPLVKASVLMTLGGIFAARRDAASAEQDFREAAAIRTQALGPEHPDTIASTLALVSVLHQPEQLAEGEALGRDTLELCHRVFGADDEKTLQAAQAYATTLWCLNREDEAAELYYDVLQRRRRLYGDTDPRTIATLAGWVHPYLLQRGRTAKAKRYGVDIYEQYRQLYGEDHPQTIGAMKSLAEILCARGELEEAVPLLLAAYDGSRRLYGELNSETLGAAIPYAIALRDLDRIDEAEAVFRTVVEAPSVPEDDPARLSALQYLGSVLYRQRDYAAAAHAFGELIDIRKLAYGRDDVTTATVRTCYSNLMFTLGKFAEAEQGHREAYQVMNRVCGPGHVNTLWCLRGLVRALAAQGKLEDARPLAEQLLERRRAIAEHPDADATQRFYYVRELLTVEPSSLRDPQRALQVALDARGMIADGFRPDDYWVAMAYRDTGNLSAAIETLARLLESTPTEESLDRSNFERLLVETCLEDGRIEEAEHVLRRTLTLRRKQLPTQDPDIADALLRLGRFLVAQGRAGDAVGALRECLTIRRVHWSDDDWRVAESKDALGEALTAQGEWDEAEGLLLEARDALEAEEFVPQRERRAVAQRLVALYEAWGKPALAQPFRRVATGD